MCPSEALGVVPMPTQKATDKSIKNGKILAVLLHSFFKIQLPPDGTRQFYVLIRQGLGRNPGLTAGAGTSMVYHSVWSGAKCLLLYQFLTNQICISGHILLIFNIKGQNGRGNVNVLFHKRGTIIPKCKVIIHQERK